MTTSAIRVASRYLQASERIIKEAEELLRPYFKGDPDDLEMLAYRAVEELKIGFEYLVAGMTSKAKLGKIGPEKSPQNSSSKEKEGRTIRYWVEATYPATLTYEFAVKLNMPKRWGEALRKVGGQNLSTLEIPLSREFLKEVAEDLTEEIQGIDFAFTETERVEEDFNQRTHVESSLTTYDDEGDEEELEAPDPDVRFNYRAADPVVRTNPAGEQLEVRVSFVVEAHMQDFASPWDYRYMR